MLSSIILPVADLGQEASVVAVDVELGGGGEKLIVVPLCHAPARPIPTALTWKYTFLLALTIRFDACFAFANRSSSGANVMEEAEELPSDEVSEVQLST